MENAYWTDAIAAMALSTPLDQIRLDDLSPQDVERLRAAVEEIWICQLSARGFTERYHAITEMIDRRLPPLELDLHESRAHSPAAG